MDRNAETGVLLALCLLALVGVLLATQPALRSGMDWIGWTFVGVLVAIVLWGFSGYARAWRR